MIRNLDNEAVPVLDWIVRIAATLALMILINLGVL